MSMVIIKRSGEEVQFNISKIVAAISKALESIHWELEDAILNTTDTLTALANTLGEYTAHHMDRFDYALHILAHSLMHYLAQGFWSVWEYAVDIITGRHRFRKAAAYYAAVPCIYVKSLTIRYRDHLWVTRKINLLRRQDRGSSEPASDNDNYFLILN
jgi:hypothetical protein